ncbi:MAG TPA: tail fiber domain-containing protein [Alphaproteobacteria bacterium]|nr:tail fiber domain-containing protein [Alphaproteobacteria bacterium]
MKIRIHGMFVSLFLAALFIFNVQPEIVRAQGTAFSYQGQLASNGVPVSGTYSLTFSLFNVASGGNAVAGPVVTNGVFVNNGLFDVTIDFGAGVWNGQTNWLQIGVETNGAASFTTLVPRQEILPVPYAIFASSASTLLGTLPLGQLPVAVVTNNETSIVTLDNLTLDGMLNLPGEVTIDSGGSLLLRVDNNGNFFAGPNAGNLTMSGGDNTGNGTQALSADTGGNSNTASGSYALTRNTTGAANTADGVNALESNTSGGENTANGYTALAFNTSGGENTANGTFALQSNVTGNNNTADGFGTLEGLGIAGGGGTNNIALGYNAGFNFSGNESYNIDIGNMGVSGESGVIRIGTPGVQTAVYIAGEIFGNGGGLTNLNGSQFGATVALNNLTLNGTLNVPEGVIIKSGGNVLMRADTNLDFFSGIGAGGGLTSGIDNTGDGFEALGSTTSGSANTASGNTALLLNNTGSGNTADGVAALLQNRTGNNNVAIGWSALANLGFSNEAGGNNNIALGISAGTAFTGNEGNNIDIGNVGVTGESGVIRIGTPGTQTVTVIAGQIIGDGSGLTNVSTYQLNGTISLANLPAAVVTTDANSTLDSLTLNGALNLPVPGTIYSGGLSLLYADYNFNFFSGLYAGNLATTGHFNTADGGSALSDNTRGADNTASGAQTMQSNSTGDDNTASGTSALFANTTGNENTAVGSTALSYLGFSNGAGGTNNIALGYEAGYAFTGNESSNIDIGNQGVVGENNIIRVGTPGIQTAAYIAGSLTVYGTLNLPATPVSINSGTDLLLYADTNSNFFSGPNAGNLATSGRGNTAVGGAALQNNTSGASNTANGNAALYFNTSGNFNMADGAGALYYNRSGNFNTAIGWGAMQNIGLGSGAGGTNNIVLGYNAGGAFTANESSNIDIGNSGASGENGIIRIGTPGIQTATYLSGTVYANGVALSSDRNAKEHFAAVNARAVLDKVAALPVSEWNYKSDKQAEHIGPMAQDFHAAFGLDGADDKHISVVDEGGVALAAIQGLNEKLEAENAELKMRLDELEAQVKALTEKRQ